MIRASAGLALLAAALNASAIVPDAPKPAPATASPAKKAPASKPDPMKEILSKFDMSGEWTVEGQRRDRLVLRGVLKVTGQRGSASYSGSMTWSSHVSGLTVQQDAAISVSGESVQVECSNVKILNGRIPEYYADRFELQVVEPKVLRGTGRDARGAQGSILLIKR